MRRSLPLLLTLLALALPSAALAQSAGDEQYADPFGQVEEPNGSDGQQAQAPEPEPAPGEPAPAEETVASQETAAPTLPATGLPAALLAGAGVLLLGGGTALRRRVS